MKNILIIGNGFDSSHFHKVSILKGINSFEFLKSKIESESQQLFNKINNTEDIHETWKNLEKVKPDFVEQEIKTFLKIVKNWSEDIDKKSIEYKEELIEPNFKKMIEENDFIVLSLNYTNLIEKIYDMPKNKVVQLHLGDNGLPYMDFNDIYVPNSDKFKKSFGIPTETPDSQKIAIGLLKEKEILKRYINNNEKEMNIYIFGASLNGVDFEYFKYLIWYLDKKCKEIMKINIYIKRYGNNCEELEWENQIDSFFSKNQLRMNLQLNYNKMETNKNKEWLNITVKTEKNSE
ncbi:abortive infection AbiH-like protein [Staphylococcus hominis]|uniref:AbiH family protein n=1 Tax=Staphylococcus hominis TaxID=1290 RepID=UPI0030BC9021